MTNPEPVFTDPLFVMQGKSVLIVGSGGFGQHIAKTLSERGVNLAVFDLNPNSLKALSDEAPNIMVGTVDISSADSIAAMIDATIARFGRIDGAVNATGVLRTGPAQSLPIADFRQSLEVNVTGAFELSRQLATTMTPQGGGRIVHIASVSSLVSNEEYAAYSASKAGLSQLVRVLAREWASQGVLLNAIGPSMADTDMTQGTFSSEEKRAQALSVIPMGRFCEAEDLTGVVLLLLSQAGCYITGQTIFVDGGRTLV
ncbi:SDR family NAD(P)-dependent oxidoreductase [Pseudopelagicola sp. nBUS_20]|uniref:SDR family NAD(P)-dependent oxidoreductase n=1 Tax=Pseudopelagicola sp. nBUS_20 TaxID=3395317 RepID=UPI003EC12819